MSTETPRQLSSGYTMLIHPGELAALLAADKDRVLICDCRFDLANPEAGQRAYLDGHIPGAHWLSLDTALSGAKTGFNGRHPLPARDDFARLMGGLGASSSTQIVAYDAANSMFAARLWWLARWLGHNRVAVLDGGLAGWRRAGYAVAANAERQAAAAGTFKAGEPLASWINYQELRQRLGGDTLIIDARAPDRFGGENETLDPVGGHIPGARNHFFGNNLLPDGRFRPAAELSSAFAELCGGTPVQQLVMSCGSGVTACHNLLALEIAGLPGAALYPGSWSEWCMQQDEAGEEA